MTLQEVWSLLNLYNSVFSGEQIDEAIGVILNGGISAAVDAAEASAAAAARSASAAAGSATEAATVVTNVNTAAQLASGSAQQAESYARGGTGTREGEDADNARYYSNVAAQLVQMLNNAAIDGRGHLVLTAPDGTVRDLGDVTGEDGSSIQSITRTAGTGAPGTTDTYTVTLTDGSTTQFQVYNGKDGTGIGDMLASVYDPQNKRQNVFQYAEDQAGAVQGNLNTHANNTTIHITADERTAWNGKENGGAAAAVQGNLNTHANNTTIHVTATEKSEWNGKAAKSNVVNITLAASGWADNVYVVTMDGVTATSNQEFLPAVDITEEELAALQAANIQDGGQTAGNITLKAYGDVPTIDIPIRVIKRGD